MTWNPLLFLASECRASKKETYVTGGTSSIQCPNVPKITDEFRISVLFVSMTLRIAMSLSTGAEMVVMSRRMEARRRNVVPTLEHYIRFMCVWRKKRED